MSHTNAWADPSLVSPEEAAHMAAFLEERSQRPDQVLVNQKILAVLDPQAGEQLLEVGSGIGGLCLMVAPQVSPGGCVVGVDVSHEFIAFARGRVSNLGLPQLHYHVGQGEHLPYPDGCFDGVWAARLLLHANDPQAIVNEMVRVVRPGGRLVMADWDFETVTVDHPDRELTRRILHWRSDHHGGDNWSGRKLLRRARRAGLEQIEITPLVYIAQDNSSALTHSLWRAAEVARDSGGIMPEEHDDWIGELKKRIDQRCFFASIVYFVLKGSV